MKFYPRGQVEIVKLSKLAKIRKENSVKVIGKFFKRLKDHKSGASLMGL